MGDHGQAEGVAELDQARRLVGRVAGDGAGHVAGVVGDDSDRAALDPGQRGNHLGGEARPQERHRALVGERLDDRGDGVCAPLALGDELAQSRLVGLGAGGCGALKVAEQSLRDRGRLGLVGDLDVDDPVGPLDRERADVVGGDGPQPPALDHRRAAHPERGVLGRDDQVGAAGDHRVAGEAAPGDDGDPRHQARELRPECERPRVEGRDDRIVGVPRPPSPTLGEEHRRQPHPLDQLEQPILLAVPEGALGSGQHRVVVGEDRTGGGISEELAVDPRGAADQAVGRGLFDQILNLAAATLGGDREAPILDEGARVDEVLDVLPRRPAPGPVAALDRLRPRLVFAQQAARPQGREVVSLSVLARPLHATREPSRSLVEARLAAAIQ